MKFLIFGAGATGRGHLGQLLYEENAGIEIVFIDKDADLVGALNKKVSYTVELLKVGGVPGRVCDVTGIKALHRSDEDKIIGAFCDAEVVLTAVIAENLDDIAEIIVKGIAERHKRRNYNPLNIICCENLNNASSYLKSTAYRQMNGDLIKYCDQTIGFPDAMISRVVPVPGDPLHMLTEDYNEWVVDKKNFTGEPFNLRCMDVADNLPARLEKKLWIHNGGHAALAYAGFLKNYKYIHEALADTELADFTGAVLNEIGNCVIHKHGFAENDVREYEADLGRRGAIAELKDDISRVARNPIRKLNISDRLLAPALYAHKNGLSINNLLTAIVNATKYYSESDEESLAMHRIIKESGFKHFIYETLSLKTEPGLAEKIIETGGRLK